MKRRSKQGVILEQLLHGMPHRYVLCWNGSVDEWGAYDCACCIGYVGGDANELVSGCGCMCHTRIEEMANSPHMRMYLLALKASAEMPFIPKDYEDWMAHVRPIKAEHDKWRTAGNPGSSPNNPSECCESCKLVIQQDKWYEEHKTDPKHSHCGGGDPTQCHICTEGRKQEPIQKAQFEEPQHSDGS